MRVRRVLAAAAAAALVTAMAGARPAAAHPPEGGLSAPVNGTVLDESPVIHGAFTHDGGFESVEMRILPGGDDPAPPPVGPTCESGSVRCEGDTATVSWAPELLYNGTYTVQVTVTGDQPPLHGDDVTRTVSRTFALAAPPDEPRRVSVVIGEDRTVTVSWQGNREPDMIGYVLYRTRNGGNRQELPGVWHEGTKTHRFVDQAPAERGGRYRYEVVGFRLGSTESWEDLVVSTGATSNEVEVDDPPEPTTTSTSATTPTAAASGSPPPTTAGAGQVDVSGFGDIRSRSTRPAPPLTIPDTGFQPTLPYTGSPTTTAPAGAAGGDVESALPLDAGGAGGAGGRTLFVPIAAGLVLFVGAFQLRWLARRADEPLEVL